MSRGDINFRMGADASQAIAENGKFKRSQRDVQEEMRGSIRVSQSMANRIIRDVENQQERFKRLRNEVFRAWQDGRLSAETYGRRVRQLEADYKSQSGAFKKFADDTKSGLEEMEQSTDEFGDAIARLGPQITAAFGATKILQEGWQGVEEAIRNAGAAVEEKAGGVGSLRQLANSQEEFDRLQETARIFELSGAAESGDEAANTVFSLQSAGLLDEESKKLFLQLGASRTVPDLAKFARAVRTQLSAFGREETGGAVQIASKAFAASAFSPASVEELLEAAAVPGGAARFLGISDEETLAATALLATSTGSATVGATSLRSLLFSTAQKEGFEGLNISQRVEKIRSKNLSTGGLLEFLGRKEAVRGFTDLEGSLGLLSEVTAAVDRANVDRSAIDRKVGFSDPLGEAARLARSNQAYAELAAETTGARRLISDARANAAEAAIADGAAPFVAAPTIGGARGLRFFAGLLGGQTGREAFEGISSDSQEGEAIEQLKKMNDNLDDLNKLTQRLLGEQISEQKETNEKLEGAGGLPVTSE